HLPYILFPRPITFCNGYTRIANRLTVGTHGGEREGPTGETTRNANHQIRIADLLMPQVPASVCRQGNRQVWETYASNFIAICIDSRDECGICFILNGGELEGPPEMGFRPIVQAESVQRLGEKTYSGDLGQGSGKRLRWYCSAIREARVAAWWW